MFLGLRYCHLVENNDLKFKPYVFFSRDRSFFIRVIRIRTILYVYFPYVVDFVASVYFLICRLKKKKHGLKLTEIFINSVVVHTRSASQDEWENGVKKKKKQKS